MTQTRDIIHLAALLHDIGKFYQRADGFWNSNEFLKKDAKNLAGIASNTSQYGTPTHQHVYWTFQFLQNESESFNKAGVSLDGENGVYNLATFHHKPNSFLQGIITLADNWSSGLDREKVIAPENEAEIVQSDIKWGKFQYKKMPLAKIFNRLVINKKIPNVNDSEQDTFNLEQLSLTRKLIIGKKLNLDAVDLTERYKQLWKDFEIEFKQLPLNDYKGFTNSLTNLLKKYTWCIPADTSTLFDNSLYEHLKVTASIAQCLYDYWDENKDSLKEDSRHRLKVTANHFPLRLWCVDLSGIQKFIYDIASKAAAKSLKGRSFYIQTLLDGIADSIINDSKIKATISNLIYSSGGKFFLLLPNTIAVNSRMKEIESEIKNELWKEYKGSIFICFGSAAWKYKPEMNKVQKIESYVPNPDIEIEGEKDLKFLGDLWKTVTDKASEQKKQKFRETFLIEESFNKFFGGNFENGGDAQLCAVTGEEHEKLVKLGDNTKVSEQVKKQIEIGEDLKNFKFLVRNNNGYELLKGLRKVSILEEFESLQKSHINYVTENTDLSFLKNSNPNSNSSFGFQWYGGSEQALLTKGKIKIAKNFEELSGLLRQDRDKNNSKIVFQQGNFNRLAILRMDVDFLGKLFTHGFDKSQASFSAYATLSASLDWFFSGYLNTIRRQEKYRDWVNIIYSGGDDVFAVGRWDSIIDFANEIQKDFKAFTGRSDISISGGISIVNSKFPIGKAALMAGDAEDKAKDFKRKIDGIEIEKNALNLFDISIGWEEFPKIETWKNKLVGWLNKDENGKSIISSGLLHKFFDYYEFGYLKNDISWKWNAAYSIARQAKDTKNETKKVALNELKNLIFTEIDQKENFRFEAFIVSCRWAELENKDKSKIDK